MALHEYKSKTSLGADNIITAMLLNLREEAKVKLLNLLNYVGKSATIPKERKISIVVPVPKSGKPSAILSKLKPTSLASKLCEITERMVLKRVNWIVEKADDLQNLPTIF